MMLHAHIFTYATDCDGPISREYVMTMNDDELAGQDEPNWFGDIDFVNRVVCSISSFYAIWHGGVLTVEVLGDEYGSEKRFTWSEDTEEGSRNHVAIICENDDCDLEISSYRDHRAESMGY